MLGHQWQIATPNIPLLDLLGLLRTSRQIFHANASPENGEMSLNRLPHAISFVPPEGGLSCLSRFVEDHRVSAARSLLVRRFSVAESRHTARPRSG